MIDNARVFLFHYFLAVATFARCVTNTSVKLVLLLLSLLPSSLLSYAKHALIRTTRPKNNNSPPLAVQSALAPSPEPPQRVRRRCLFTLFFSRRRNYRFSNLKKAIPHPLIYYVFVLGRFSSVHTTPGSRPNPLIRTRAFTTDGVHRVWPSLILANRRVRPALFFPLFITDSPRTFLFVQKPFLFLSFPSIANRFLGRHRKPTITRVSLYFTVKFEHLYRRGKS